MSSNGLVLHYELPALYGFFTELNPMSNPLTTLAAAKGLQTTDSKIYQMVYHTNWEAGTLSDVGVKPDASTPTYGSTEHADGSNTVQIFDQGAAVTFARLGDQRLSAVQGWKNPQNQSVEPNPMPRTKAEALDRIKSMTEFAGREGTYTIPHAGTTSGTTGIWMQRGLRYASGLEIGTASGCVYGTGTLGTFGTLNFDTVMDCLQGIWDKKLWVPGRPMLALCNSTVKRELTRVFKDELDMGKNGISINRSGVNLLQFETDFGMVEIVMSHNWPKNDLYFLNMDYINMIARPVPGKPNGGLLFERDIPAVNSLEAVSYYGELGLNYMTGSAHGRMAGIGSAVVGGQNFS